jgi:Sensors of blue-light using FAD
LDALVSLIYVSSAAHGLGAADIEAIHRGAERDNARHGVTGALLCYDGRFVQVLEGPAAVVQAVYERIRADTRHRDLRLLIQGPTSERLFGQWSMRRVPEPDRRDRTVVAFLDQLQREPDVTAQAHTALKLLLRLATAT